MNAALLLIYKIITLIIGLVITYLGYRLIKHLGATGQHSATGASRISVKSRLFSIIISRPALGTIMICSGTLICALVIIKGIHFEEEVKSIKRQGHELTESMNYGACDGSPADYNNQIDIDTDNDNDKNKNGYATPKAEEPANPDNNTATTVTAPANTQQTNDNPKPKPNSALQTVAETKKKSFGIHGTRDK